MRICPECGQELTGEAEACEHCGARLSSRGSTRRYIASLAALLAIIVVAALAHSFLRSNIVRPPTDFLPASTHLAIGLDLRPGSPAMSRMGTSWSQSEIHHLGVRATDLAQELVDLTGIQLDLERDASRWFGGELVVASLPGADARTLRPRSFVLIARATNCRRARASLDKAVAPFAREAGWRRSVVRSGRYALTLWGAPDARTALAYITQDGCVVISANDVAVERCLAAAEDPSQTLTESEDFVGAISPLPSDYFLWCYASTPHLLFTARDLLPALSEGWPAFIKRYRDAAIPARAPEWRKERPHAAASATLALTFKPETTGVRLRARYRRGSRRERPSPPHFQRLLQLVPREALAYALVHDPARWSNAFQLALECSPPRRTTDAGMGFLRVFLSPMAALLNRDLLPDDALVILLPRERHAGKPALVVALPAAPSARKAPQLPAFPPLPATATIHDTLVYGSDREAIRQCRRAAEDPAQRIDHEITSNAGLQAWARPAELLHEIDWIEELHVELSEGAVGAEADCYLTADPARLLGP